MTTWKLSSKRRALVQQVFLAYENRGHDSDAPPLEPVPFEVIRKQLDDEGQGDTLFTYILREAAGAQSKEELIGYLQTAVMDLEHVIDQLEGADAPPPGD